MVAKTTPSFNLMVMAVQRELHTLLQCLVSKSSPQANALGGTVPSFHSYFGAFITSHSLWLLTNWTAFESFLPLLPCAHTGMPPFAQMHFPWDTADAGGGGDEHRVSNWLQGSITNSDHNLPPTPTTQAPALASI